MGFPAMIALSAAIELPIKEYVPSMQELLKKLGIDDFDLPANSADLAKDIVSALEARAIWARYGL